MPFHLLSLEATDIPTAVSLYFAAFQNAHSLACWPRDSPHVRAWWEQMFRDELHEPGAHWLKVVDDDDDSNPDSGKAGMEGGGPAIVGYAKWVAPRPGVAPDTALPEWPRDADAALCDETFGAWARAHVALMGTRGHWYLEQVGVDPAYQGKGIGSLLIRFGTEKADEQGVEAFLEASPAGVSLYEKLGFREADRLDTMIDNDRVRSTLYRNIFMIRPAKR